MLKKKHLKMKKLFLENKLLRNKLLLEGTEEKFDVTSDQFDALDSLRSNIMNVELGRNNETFDGDRWATFLDELGISWSIQNWVSSYAHDTSNVHSGSFKEKFNIVETITETTSKSAFAWKDEYVDEEFWNIDGLNIEYIAEGTYEDDYKKAYEVAKELGGEVYTVVDAGASDVIYHKGETDINRLEVIVVYFDDEMVTEATNVVEIDGNSWTYGEYSGTFEENADERRGVEIEWDTDVPVDWEDIEEKVLNTM